VFCDDQEQLDYYWSKLSEGGEEGPCGWLKDKYGVSWQIIPAVLPDLIGDPDPEKAKLATEAMLSMGKFDIAALERAPRGRAGGERDELLAVLERVERDREREHQPPVDVA
jgi:hypothetical protein